MKNKKVSRNKIYLNSNRLIFRNIVSLLIGQSSLLILFFVALTPVISLIYRVALKVTRFSYVTIDNLKKFLLNPVSILMILLLFIMIGLFLLLEIYYLTIFFGQVEEHKKVKVHWIIMRALYKVLFDIVKGNIRLIPIAWSTLGIFNIPLLLFVLYKTRVMRYFASEISNIVYRIIIVVLIIGLLFLFLFRNAFVFHNYLLGNMTCKEAIKGGKNSSKNHILRTFFYFVGWNILITLVIAILYLFLTGVTMILVSSLFNKQLATATFIYLNENMEGYLITVIFLICTIANLALYTRLFYFYQLKTETDDELPKNFMYYGNKIGTRSYKKILIGTMLILISINLYFFVKILINGSPLDYMNLDRIEVTSHRGFSHDVPENTLPAIEKAIEDRTDYIEVDVRVTKDGVPVLLHDSNLERTTGVDKYIWNMTYAEVARLDAGKWMDESFAGTRIPTLSEVLENCKGRVGINLEIKYPSTEENLIEKVISLIDQYEMEWQCVISSTNLNYLKQVKELNPNIQTGYISYQLYPGLTENESVDFFSMKSNLVTKNILRRIHENGKKLIVWTVNSKTELERLERIGVDNIITDNPAKAKEVLYQSASEGYLLTLLQILME